MLAAETTAWRGTELGSGAGGTGVQPDGGGPKSGGGGSDGFGPPTPGLVLSRGNSRAVLALDMGRELGTVGLSAPGTVGLSWLWSGGVKERGSAGVTERGSGGLALETTALCSSAGAGVRRGITLGRRGDEERVCRVESSSPASSCRAGGG